MSALLEWLWDAICGPILEALGFQNAVLDNVWRRVWWVPTGLLSQLPLHAAGYHTQGSKRTVIDRVISSYASSVKALIYGNRYHCRQPARPPSDHALLVAMHETPGLSTNRTLPFVATEAEMFTNLCPSLQLKLITPQPRKDDVLRQLGLSRIFHFAGHGKSDPTEPSKSCLLLEDWKTNPLTVGDLRSRKIQQEPPFLAYLSACSTGANEVSGLLDEGIHLVSAFQLAGFRHVVGTLWEVSDRHCVDVARVLYETICDVGMTDWAVCLGLHQAIRALRNTRVEKAHEDRDATLVDSRNQTRDQIEFSWVPYVHFGVMTGEETVECFTEQVEEDKTDTTREVSTARNLDTQGEADWTFT
jgi:CHAT domain-containing protein